MRAGLRVLCGAFAVVLLVPVAGAMAIVLREPFDVVRNCPSDARSVNCWTPAQLAGIAAAFALALLLGAGAIAGSRALLTIGAGATLAASVWSALTGAQSAALALPLGTLSLFLLAAAASAMLARGPAQSQRRTLA